jgi:hypothetical protein
MRALDLNDRQPTGPEPAREPGPIAAGPLDPDLLDHPERLRPRHQLGKAGRGRRDTPRTQASTELVERHPDMEIGVRIDADRDPSRSIRGIAAR